MEIIKQIKIMVPYLILFLFFVVNVVLMWPGGMTPDSHAQYQMALSGIFNDANPPMMSLVWSLLNHLYKGSGLLMIFHLALLYGAAAFFMASFCGSRLAWLYLLFPMWPQISLYSCMIWKDVGFAFSFLLVSAVLSFCMMKRKKMNFLGICIITLLLFYGTAVKFQAIYVVPFLLIGFGYCLNNFALNRKIIFFSGISYIIFYIALQYFNDLLVLDHQKSHFWQYVKLYDLAAISLKKQQALFPEFILNYPDFSMQALAQKFNYDRVDDIAFLRGSPLRKGTTLDDREALWNCWFKAVVTSPFYYAQHRFLNWYHIINGMPLQRLETLDFNQFGGSSQRDFLIRTIVTVLRVTRHLFRFIFLLPFILFYFALGIYALGKDRAGMPLFMMNGVGIAMLVALFFFSMASSLRYVYITVCMVHASHVFAYTCLKRLFFANSRFIK